MQRRHPLRTLGQALSAGTIVGSTEIHPDLIPATRDLQAGTATAYPYPTSIMNSHQAVICNYTATQPDITEGQPFLLTTISELARRAGDPDYLFPLQCQHGLPLGVDEVLPDTRHIWSSKMELTSHEAEEAELEQPMLKPNYPSADEHADAIEKTFSEEVGLGMVTGPHTPSEAAAICGCRPDQLCHGALAGKPEGRYLDKLRTIHDAPLAGSTYG